MHTTLDTTAANQPEKQRGGDHVLVFSGDISLSIDCTAKLSNKDNQRIFKQPKPLEVMSNFDWLVNI